MNHVFLLLGSNIAKETNLPAAVAILRTICRDLTLSSVYETIPISLKEQQNFFNIGALIETDLDPCQIKQQIILPIENQLKRQRKPNKNAPRTIDLDIILFNDEILDYMPDDGLVHHIPDPDLVRFAHVAVPMAELAPYKLHPETSQTLTSIAAQLLAEANTDNVTLLWKREDFQLD